MIEAGRGLSPAELPRKTAPDALTVEAKRVGRLVCNAWGRGMYVQRGSEKKKQGLASRVVHIFPMDPIILPDPNRLRVDSGTSGRQGVYLPPHSHLQLVGPADSKQDRTAHRPRKKNTTQLTGWPCSSRTDRLSPFSSFPSPRPRRKHDIARSPSRSQKLLSSGGRHTNHQVDPSPHHSDGVPRASPRCLTR